MSRARVSKEAFKKTRIVAARSFMAVIGVGFGVLITAQWKSVPDRVTNPIAPYSSLKETKESLYTEQADLKSEINKLQNSIQQIQKDSKDSILTKNQINQLKTEKAYAGLTKLNGPGIIITLDDSKNSIVTDDSIVHAADLRDVVNLLWGSGAEGISINGQRVVVNTAIDCIVNTILVNSTRLSTPFKIEAVGDQEQMYNIMNNSLILSNIHDRAKNQGLVLNVARNDDITLPLFDGSFEVKTEGASS